MCGGGGDGGSGGGDGSGGGGGGDDMTWWASRPRSNRTWASWRGGGARNAEVETANGMRLPCLRATVRCTAGILDQKTDAEWSGKNVLFWGG